ncbi:MAG: hypothetical protein C4527_19575 [Candidatus Omnitrophota bacterium]|jgi:hypothetical protein|nr:MAG: hypothetical protein C4527_19575 [Candidatus Omnitrophota bacterium]
MPAGKGEKQPYFHCKKLNSMMKNPKPYFLLCAALIVVSFPTWSLSKTATHLDLVKLKNGTVLEGHIVSQTARSLNLENVGGMISILRESIDRVITAEPGESAMFLGAQLLERKKFARAEFFLKIAAEYPAWRTESNASLQKLNTIKEQLEEQRREKEKSDIEKLIRRKGVEAGISELERRHSAEDDYWGSVRGRLHLLMARERLDHYDLKMAEQHLTLAEKYGVTKEQWESVRNEIVAMRRKSLLYGEDKLASRAFQSRKRPDKTAAGGGLLALAGEAKKKGEKVPPLEWLELVDRYAGENDVDPLLIWALIDTESSWRSQVVSPKGAQGLMQLMPLTAKDLEVDNPFDPEENIRGGIRYLRFLLKMFKDTDTALAAYYVGPGRVERYNGIPPAGREYVQKVRTREAALNKRFGLSPQGRTLSKS